MSKNTQQIDDIPALVARLRDFDKLVAQGEVGMALPIASLRNGLQDAAAAFSRLTRERDAARAGEDLFRAQAYAAQDALATALRERDEARNGIKAILATETCYADAVKRIEERLA